MLAPLHLSDIMESARGQLTIRQILDDPDFDAEIIAQQGVEAASTFNVYCDQPIDSYAMAMKESAVEAEGEDIPVA